MKSRRLDGDFRLMEFRQVSLKSLDMILDSGLKTVSFHIVRLRISNICKFNDESLEFQIKARSNIKSRSPEPRSLEYRWRFIFSFLEMIRGGYTRKIKITFLKWRIRAINENSLTAITARHVKDCDCCGRGYGSTFKHISKFKSQV